MPTLRFPGVTAVVSAVLFAAVVAACAPDGPAGPADGGRGLAASPPRLSMAPLPTMCPISYGALDDQKPNKLYLYYPGAADATYPEFGFSGLSTSPVPAFGAAQLPSYTGTTADLRDGITSVVRDTYCEFNVQVRQTTTAPPNTFARRNTIAIGTDSTGACGGETWGLAEAVDAGDATAVDFARVWAGSYQRCAGGVGGQLNGVNSTLARWARSVGGTAAHEAGHNYGVSHSDGLVLAAGEDVLQHHVMAAGSNFSYADRAGYRRHFSDREYSILANNVGLSVQTMWNWDFINPNAATGRRLRMDFLSAKPSLILSWDYEGSRSPWVDPVVSGPLGTQTFKGVTYNRYRIEWSTGQAWDEGPSGQVPGGAPFHVGATFSGVDYSSTPDPIIITNVQLLDASSNPLPMHPRIMGYDAGTLDAASGNLDLRFFNMAAAPLVIQNLVVHELPRLISLDAMIPGGRMVDTFGEPFQPWPKTTRTLIDRQTLERGQEVKLTVANLRQAPHVYDVVDERDCAIQDAMKGPDVAKCRPGISRDLFPSTALYVTATVIEPNVRYWDRRLRRYVVGPLASQLFYQIAGRRLDAKRQ